MKKYLIKSLSTNQYWYGYYTSQQWTLIAEEAKFFDCKEDAENIIFEFKSGIYTVEEVIIQNYPQ